MKLKAIAAGVICALSLSAFAARRPVNPSPQTPSAPKIPATPLPNLPGGPSLPGLPGFPGFPGFPGGPTDPNFPQPLPPPGPQSGPEVPFPMSITLPFPWGYIEGVWKTMTDGGVAYFSFTVQTDVKGRTYLRVLQIDAASGAVLAQGVGLSVEKDKLVRAAMSSADGRSNYMLFIGSYQNTNRYVVGGQAQKALTVLTVRPFSNLEGGADVQVIVTKVSNGPLQADECL